jgi:hypothetical protein
MQHNGMIFFMGNLKCKSPIKLNKNLSQNKNSPKTMHETNTKGNSIPYMVKKQSVAK